MLELIRNLIMKVYFVTLTTKNRGGAYTETKMVVRSLTPWQAFKMAEEEADRQNKIVYDIRRLK